MPKKGSDEGSKVQWGRPGNNVKIGLVGLPNVGKSSTFNLLGSLQVAAENYPFCTIEPAHCTVEVPDNRYTHLCDAFKPKSTVPAVLTVTDIAGLVKGAAEGAGLGNAFLSNIQAVDAIYHVSRAFIDKDIEHVEGEVDPVRDFEIINNELVKKDIQFVETALEKLVKATRNKASKEDKAEMEILEKALAHLKEGKLMRGGDFTPLDIISLNKLNLLTAKPTVYLVNISEKNFMTLKNKWFKDIKVWMDKNAPGDALVPYSVVFEQKLQAMATQEERDAFCKANKTKSMMPKIIKSGYQALRCINFFTCGADEVRAWTIRDGYLAPQAAGTIHGDFEKFFIKAEVYNYDDFKEHGGEKECKAAGKVREQGKAYVCKDGDIMFFKHNAK